MDKKIKNNKKKRMLLTSKAKGRAFWKKSTTYSKKIVKKLGQKNKENQTTSAEFLSRHSAAAIKQAVLELDNFLVDEQISYSLAEKTKSVREEFAELSRIVLGEQSINQINDFLPLNEIKISLGKDGQIANKQKIHQQANSVYLIDLKKEEEPSHYFKRPPQHSLENFFSSVKQPLKKPANHQSADFNMAAPSLVSSKKLIDRLDEWGTRIYQSIEKFWPKRIFSVNYFSQGKLQKELNPWLINFKLALNFALVALLLVVPIRGLFFYQSLVKTKGQVLGVSEGAMTELKSGAQALSQDNWQQASLNFGAANSYLNEAQSFLNQYNQSFWELVKLVPAAGKKITAYENLLNAGQAITIAARNLTQIFLEAKEIGNLDDDALDKFSQAQNDLGVVIENLNNANLSISQVAPDDLPLIYRDYFIELNKQLPKFRNRLADAQAIMDFLLKLLGNEAPKRYLLMFQNPYELRPSGGFFGSYAILDLKKGKILNLEIPGGGTYDLKGSFTKKVISPEPLHLVGSAWNFWDANWWPDFPTTAKKEMWFLENSGGPTVDGVIAINATLIPEILKIIGNIELTKYNKVFTPAEAVLALQHATLFEYDKKANQPKAIIADLAPELIKRLLNIKTEQTLPLLSVFNQALKEKEIQFYFTETSLQQPAANFGWTGELLKSDNDYLMVVDSNIGGGKTNAYIEQQINHYAYLQDDQSIVDTVSIVRKHNGNLIDKKDANYVFAKENNVSFVKIYVPQGAELLETTGYNLPDSKLFKEVYPGFVEDEYLNQVQGAVKVDPITGTYIYVSELGKTAFGNWTQVRPGEEATITFSYRLPKFKTNPSFLDKIYLALGKKETIDYSLLAQRQSGAFKQSFNSYLFYPENFEAKWSSGINSDNLKPAGRGLFYSSDLMSDQFYAVILQKVKK